MTNISKPNETNNCDYLDCESLVYKNDIRIATTLELYAGKRLTSDEAVYLNNTLMALKEVS